METQWILLFNLIVGLVLGIFSYLFFKYFFIKLTSAECAPFFLGKTAFMDLTIAGDVTDRAEANHYLAREGITVFIRPDNIHFNRKKIYKGKLISQPLFGYVLVVDKD